MLLVGLTGNIASGKSVVAGRLAALGATVIDADVLAREVVAPDSPALAAIVARWGPGLLTPGGALDRARLRQVVFADAAERERLNAIVHPAIEARRRELVERARRSGAAVVVCEIPLLFERDLGAAFDVLVLVDAPVAERLERLTRLRGLGEDEARAMEAAQLPSGAKRTKVHHVIDNTGTRAELEEATDRLWRELSRQAASAS